MSLQVDRSLFNDTQSELLAKASKSLEVEYVNGEAVLELNGPPSKYFVYRGHVLKAKPLGYQRGIRLTLAMADFRRIQKREITEETIKILDEKVYSVVKEVASELLEYNNWFTRLIWKLSGKKPIFEDVTENELTELAVFFYKLKTT